MKFSLFGLITNFLMPFQGVNFEVAEDILRGRLTKLSKKIDVLRKKKQKQSDSTISNDLSRTEVSKVGDISVFAAFKNI